MIDMSRSTRAFSNHLMLAQKACLGVGLCFFILLASLPRACSTPLTAMRGVNLSGAEGGNIPGQINYDFTYNSEGDFQYYGGKGLTLIRIPIAWERIQPTLNGPLDSTNLNALLQDVAWSKAHGDKVIIDVHSGAQYRGYPIDTPDANGVIHVTTANLSNLWVQISNQFKNEPTIYAYDLMNEPHFVSTPSWHRISQDALSAIRSNNDNKMIMVGGAFFSGAGDWISDNAVSGNSNPWITDPANNFKYEAHQYFDQYNRGDYENTYDEELAMNPNLATVGTGRLAHFVDWCHANGVVGYLGEYGIPLDDSRWNAVLDNFLSALDAANFDGTYWCAGDWYGTSDPSGINASTHAPNGRCITVQPPNPQFITDEPQMPILVKHIATHLAAGAYNGPHNLPGLLQAEDYDTGGEGIAYHETINGGQTGYRSDNNGDIHSGAGPNGNNYALGWSSGGDWYKYTVSLAATGSYTAAFQVASAGTGGTFHLQDEAGNNLTGTLSAPNTGSYGNWQTVTSRSFTLSAGTHILRLVEDANGPNPWVCDFDWISITSAAASAATFGTGTEFDDDAGLSSGISSRVASAAHGGDISAISAVNHALSAGIESRMVGGAFECSNTSATIGYTTLAIVPLIPIDGLMHIIAIPSPIAYHWLRYRGLDGDYCHVAKI